MRDNPNVFRSAFILALGMIGATFPAYANTAQSAGAN